MSILSDKGLVELQNEHSDFIQPFDEEYVQPSSVDLHFRLNKGVICPPLADETDVVENFSRIVLPPSELVLISTLEKIHIPNGYVGRVEGVSSLARIGLLVHITSGFIDPNFKGHITLEVVNMNRYPIVLQDGARICQLVVEKSCFEVFFILGCSCFVLVLVMVICITVFLFIHRVYHYIIRK